VFSSHFRQFVSWNNNNFYLISTGITKLLFDNVILNALKTLYKRASKRHVTDNTGKQFEGR